MFRLPTLEQLDLKALFNASPNPYLLLDPDLRIAGVNAAYLKVTMRRLEDLLGKPVFDCFPSDPQSVHGRQIRESLARVLAEGRPHHIATIHYPIARPDGTLQDSYWSASHTPLHAADGSVGFILQHTEDVTEMVQLRSAQSTPVTTMGARLMQRTQALHAERDYLRQVFDQAPGFMAVLREPNHVFEIVNRALQELLGPRPLVGRSVLVALPEIESQGFIRQLDEVYATGRLFVGRNLTVRLQRRAGAALESRQVNFVFQPLLDDAGAVNGIFVQGQDITDQEHARQLADNHKARFAALSDAMPNQVWTARSDGNLDWCNQQTLRYSGLPSEKLHGAAWASIVHPQDLPAALAAWQHAVTSVEPYHVEFRLRRHDGEYRWHLARALPVRGPDSKIRQWVGTNTDIEDHKASAALLAELNTTLARRIEQRTAELDDAQQALRRSQKLEAIGKLAGGIAHDFNNLLQVVGGNVQLLSRHLAGQAELQVLATRALAGVGRGAKLASQLLAFGRRQALAPEVVNVGRLVRGMDDMLRSSLGAAVEIDTVIAGGLWNTLIDPSNLENALLNLALNARDAMDDSGKLTIEAGNAWLDDRYSTEHDQVSAGQYVMVAVSDTGCGMGPDVLERAFEPFFTTKPEGKGTGLGLSMVYGFVKQSGGHVKVYSEPGSGTTVRLYLPRSNEAEDRPVKVETALPHPGGETILVAEDDEAVREVTVGLLKDLGYRVLTARDAQSALTIIDSGVAIDLLFTDVVMPGPLRSADMARKARLRRPSLAVLFTSGYTENSIVHGGRLDPGVQLLSKPYTREALARKVHQCLLLARGGEPQTPAAPAEPELPRVVLCEDDPLLRETLAEALASMNCRVWAAASVAQAKELLTEHQPRLLVTDLGLPDGDGRQLALWTRQRLPQTLIAIASGRTLDKLEPELADVMMLRKPFDIADLSALLDRVR